jgi:hypothetical protein
MGVLMRVRICDLDEDHDGEWRTEKSDGSIIK